MRGTSAVVLGILLLSGCVFDRSGLPLEGDGPAGADSGRHDLTSTLDLVADADLSDLSDGPLPDAPLDADGPDLAPSDGPKPEQPTPSDGPQPDQPPPADTKPQPDLGGCPSVCDSCDKATATCTIVETAWVKVTCPAGWNCKLTCTGTDACRSGVDCTQAKSCDITCGGSGDDQCKSGALICGPGYCKIACTGKDSCLAGIDCSLSCGCEITCSGGGSCSGATQCPSSSACCSTATPCSCP